MKKRLTNLFLFLFLVVIAIDAYPSFCREHQQLKDWLDPFVDISGLWQGHWDLFAPDVDKVNVALSAKISFPDGAEVNWRSPDWTKMSVAERFVRFREMEFIDSIRMNENRPAWPGFADYIARNTSHPFKPSSLPSAIVLSREWAVVPRPNENDFQKYKRPEFRRKLRFYSTEYEQ